ncbi:LysM peptidoglycan-binding domain-containing protein [Coprococcus sp. AF21-14LB]|uniref:LysM peptidoglycan-binding domain-containing protein n=1 Tax=Coprococcus sp. AF21-14LB TaxID=2292231 RepID=UPI000E498AB7|nr:LysM peptidoglycan-binding domain-containing protein [Coprococcus sp. AF21-14LB]RGS80357.1 LysM peptidoglycan-binding domain-containing protein [Coprococcus sp. AF21-14LB]
MKHKSNYHHHNPNNQTNHNHRRRSSVIRIRAKRLFMVICMLIVISCTLLLGSAFASAHDSSEKNTNNKYYKCIEVAPGETLWTIADRYASTEYDSYQEYIDEVIQINQMDCSTLYADQKLIIPYYAEEHSEDIYTASALMQ